MSTAIPTQTVSAIPVDFKSLFEQKLLENKAINPNSNIAMNIAFKEINATRLQEIRNAITEFCTDPELVRNEAVPAPNFNVKNFNFRSGELISLLKQINSQYDIRDNICEHIGLSPVALEIFIGATGSFTYYNKSSNSIIDGKPFDVAVMKESMQYIANELGLVLTDYDLGDITEERLRATEEYNAKRATKTVDFAIRASEQEQQPLVMEV